MNILDIRPSCNVPCPPETRGYSAIRTGNISAADAEGLLPDRATLGLVWRYLSAVPAPIQEEPMCLCRKIVRWSGVPLSLGQLLTCLDIFRDVGLLQIHRIHRHITIHLTPGNKKADLNQSQTMQILLRAKES